MNGFRTHSLRGLTNLPRCKLPPAWRLTGLLLDTGHIRYVVLGDLKTSIDTVVSAHSMYITLGKLVH
jgi:hypothetical protein